MKVLITGASRGIGLSLAKIYDERLSDVYGVARTFEDPFWEDKRTLQADLD